MPLTKKDEPVVFRSRQQARHWGAHEWVRMWKMLNQGEIPKLTAIQLPSEVDYAPITIAGFPKMIHVPKEVEDEEGARAGRLVTATIRVGVIQVAGKLREELP